jgi:hypothetical protein
MGGFLVSIPAPAKTEAHGHNDWKDASIIAEANFRSQPKNNLIRQKTTAILPMWGAEVFL